MSAPTSGLSERDRVLNKIQKCLRLSKSSEPHEAAAALRQAQALMRHHAVSDTELAGFAIKHEAYVSNIIRSKKLPQSLTIIIAVCCKAMGVQAVVETDWRNFKPYFCVRYFGPEGRPQMATFAHGILYRESLRAWTAHLRANPQYHALPGARMGFLVAWLQTVRQTVMDFGFPADEVKATKLAQVEKYGQLAEAKSNAMKLYGSTSSAGRDAAAGFSLNRPMSGAEQRRLSN